MAVEYQDNNTLKPTAYEIIRIYKHKWVHETKINIYLVYLV